MLFLFFFAHTALLPSLPADAQGRTNPVGQAEGNRPVYGGIYRRPLSGDPTILDPAQTWDIYSTVVMHQIFDGLVQYDEGTTIRPALAESWHASRDGLTWTFKLRRGVRFHHGRELSSDDVVFSLARVLNPKTKSPGAGLLAKVKGARDYTRGLTNSLAGVRGLDQHTIQVVLEEPWAPFLSAMAAATSKIVPKDEVLRLGDNFGLTPVGTGPFTFVSWERNKRIVLGANRDYFAGPPFLKSVEIRIFPGGTVDEMFEAFRKHELDDSPVPASERARLSRDETVRFVSRPALGLQFLGLTQSFPPLDKLKVRQALYYAIDRGRHSLDIFQGKLKAAWGILSPGTLGFNPELQRALYDPKRSATLLAEAGYPAGKGLPRFPIWSAVTAAENLREDEAIVRELAAIGVRAELRYNPDWPSFDKNRRLQNLPIFRLGWYADVPDPDNFLQPLFHSQGSENSIGYRNARLDSLLSQAAREQDPRRRVTIYRDAERLILDDAPIIPLTYSTYERVFQPYVRGLQVSALGDPYIRLNEVWLDTRR